MSDLVSSDILHELRINYVGLGFLVPRDCPTPDILHELRINYVRLGFRASCARD